MFTSIIKPNNFKQKFNNSFLEYLELFDKKIENVASSFSRSILTEFILSLVNSNELAEKYESNTNQKSKDIDKTLEKTYDLFFGKKEIEQYELLYQKYQEFNSVSKKGSIEYFFKLQLFVDGYISLSCYIETEFHGTKLYKHNKYSEYTNLFVYRLIHIVYEMKNMIINKNLDKYIIPNLVNIVDLYLV